MFSDYFTGHERRNLERAREREREGGVCWLRRRRKQSQLTVALSFPLSLVSVAGAAEAPRGLYLRIRTPTNSQVGEAATPVLSRVQTARNKVPDALLSTLLARWVKEPQERVQRGTASVDAANCVLNWRIWNSPANRFASAPSASNLSSLYNPIRRMHCSLIMI